jgi:putative endonuclease
MTSKRLVGTHYEEKAAKYLEKKDFRILEKNVNYRWGEIDLIAIDLLQNELVFVEVRHRMKSAMTSAAESVSHTKQIRMKRAIETYLVSPKFNQLGLKLNGIRIDLLAFDGEVVQHWQNFF